MDEQDEIRLIVFLPCQWNVPSLDTTNIDLLNESKIRCFLSSMFLGTIFGSCCVDRV